MKAVRWAAHLVETLANLLIAGVARERWHEYVLRVYEFQAGRGAVGDPIIRWVLPAVMP